MSLGTLLAIFLSERSGLGLHRPGVALMLTICWAAILLLSSPIVKAVYKLLSWGEPSVSRLSTIQREMGFGATLTFLSTVAVAVISLLASGRMKTPSLVFALTLVSVVLLVISPYLLRAIRYLVMDESTVPGPGSITEGPTTRSLPPVQEAPLAFASATRVTTAEIGVPVPSVTEHTTTLLGEK
jgi:hypothetical protein